MFIKLNFSASVKLTVPLRILADIISTPSITSVSALQSRFTSAGYHSSLTGSFDAANSNIIRTTDPTNTKAHVSFWNSPANGDIIVTIQQPVYDSGSNYIYTQLCTDYVTNTPGTNVVHHRVGSSINNAMTDTQAPVTLSEGSATATGTKLTLGGGLAISSNQGAMSYGSPGVYTFWAYVTAKCFFWAVNGSATSTGWAAVANYSNSTYVAGPLFTTQYTRYDYTNTMSNNIFPAFYSAGRYGAGATGYGSSTDITATNNIFYTTNNYSLPLRVHSLINNIPNATVSWPLISHQYVNMTMNGVSSSNFGLNSVQTTANVASAVAVTYAGSYSSASSTRYATSNLSATGFGIMPFGWECNYYNNHGGNATDQSGVYMFNGEYSPGDTFTMGGNQYMIWPMWSGNSNRLGFAVPML